MSFPRAFVVGPVRTVFGVAESRGEDDVSGDTIDDPGRSEIQ